MLRNWLTTLKSSFGTLTRRRAPRRPLTGWRRKALLQSHYSTAAEVLEDRTLLSVNLSGVTDWTDLGFAPQINQTSAAPNGPASGGVEELAIDPNDPSRMFAGTINGGIWFTSDGDRPFDGVDNDGINGVDDLGEQPTWVPLTDRFPTLSIGDIRFDPLDATSNTLFAGTGSTSSLSNTGGPAIGIMTTIDGGATWTVTPLSPGSEPLTRAILPTTIDYDPVAAGVQQVVLVGTVRSSDGMYRSTDGGATYTNISGLNGLPTGPVTDLLVDPNDANRIYAAVVGDGVFFTDDGGDNWTATDNGTLNVAGSTVIQLTAHPGGGTTVWHTLVSGPTPMAFTSNDGGTNWTPLLAIPAAFTSGFNGLYTDMASDQIIADPGNSAVVQIAKGYGGSHVYTYNPAGPSWDRIEGVASTSNTSPHVDHRDLKFVGNNLITANDGGLYFLNNPSNPGGNQWSSMHGVGASGLSAAELTNVTWDSTFNVVYGGAQDNGTAVQNGFLDRVWTNIRGADGGDAQVDTVNAGAGRTFRYTATQNFGLQRHTFDSATNQPVGAVALVPAGGLAGFNNYFVPVYELNQVDPSRLVTGGSGTSPVYELLNAATAPNAAGANWQAVPVGAGFGNVNDNDDAPFVYGGRMGGVDNPEVLIVGSGGNVFVRSTAGGTLTATPTAFPGGTVQGIATDPQNWQHFFVIDGSTVWETPDAGTNWTPLTRNLASVNTRLQSIAYIPTATSGVVVVGGNLGVSRLSLDSPDTLWSRFGSSFPNALVGELEYHASDDVLLAGTFGRGAFLVFSASTLVQNTGVLEINGDMDFAGQDDVILLVRDENNPSELNVFVNGVQFFDGGQPFELDTIEQINVNGLAGNDTLIVDSTYGMIDIGMGIRYDGEIGFDRLDVVQTDGPVRDSSSVFVGATNGSGRHVLVDDAVTQTIDFTGLEPVIDNVAAATFNVSSVAGLASLLDAANTINYTASQLILSGGRVTVDAFEPIEFTNKTNLVIDARAGEDNFFGNNAALPTGLETITVNGEDGNDDLTFVALPNAGATSFVSVTANGDAGEDVIDASEIGVSTPFVINGGDDDDVLFGGAGSDIINGGAGSDTINGGGGTDSVNGGTGADTILVKGADQNETITVDLNAGDLDVTENAGTVTTTYSSIAGDSIENVRIEAGTGLDTINVDSLANIAYSVLGGDPAGELQQPVGDILNVSTGGAAFQFLPGPEPDSGTVSVTGSQPISFDEIELLQINGVNHILPDRFDDPDLVFAGNDSIPTATNLGSEKTVIERRLTLHNEGAGVVNEDFFQITAHDTGKMIFNVFFTHDLGNINIEVHDITGDVVASATSMDDNEQLIIPVVAQEQYFLRVLAAPGGEQEPGQPNIYNLEIENFAAPVPNTVHLDPASDTGMFNHDHLTADTTPRFVIQADLQDFADMGIDILTAAQAESNLADPNVNQFPGAAVEVHIISGTTGIVHDAPVGGLNISGFADAIGVSNILFEFEPTNPLPDDVYFVSAAVRIFDNQNTPSEDGRTQLSDPLWFTIDASPPKGMVLETFRADLTGAQEVPLPVETFAGGDALLRLNPAENRLDMVIELAGLDLGNLTADPNDSLTPNDTTDDVIGLHIHRAAAGVNGPVVFGLFNPDNDLNGPIVDVASGRISASWDLNEGNGTTLAAELANLRTGNLYFNVHTAVNPGGEIRGQILSAGGAIQMLESSDTGMSVIDGVTNIQSPAFVVKGEANAKVRIFARNTLTGTVNQVGSGVIGSDNTDGVNGNGFGIAEITVEPMADGTYEFFAEFEDLAGNISSHYDFPVIDTPTPLNDNASTEVEFDVQGLFGNIADLDVKFTLLHDDLTEIELMIEAPDGTMLASGAIFSGANFIDTVFDDDAATSILAGAAPYTGHFNVGGLLDAFDGIDPNGTWTLTVIDNAAGIVGEVTDLRLCIETDGGLPVEIDTLAPNTAFLDLAEASDTGRHNDDNVTMDNTPDVTITTTDPNPQFHTLYTDNLKFRIYDRLEGDEEFLLYNSALDGPVDAISTIGDSYTSLQFILETLPDQYFTLIGVNDAVLGLAGALADGIHNFKLEVEDRAGNISHDFLNNVLIDTVAPAPPSIVIDAADSDTGVPGYPATIVDNITSDTTAGFVGNAEADSIVRVAANGNSLGLTVAVPLDGDDAFPLGEWEIDPNLDYNDPVFGMRDGLRSITATAEDLAGNVGEPGQLDIFIDTQGPQVFDPDGAGADKAIQVVTNGVANATFDLFDIKPTIGPTPRVDGLLINVQDQPERIAAFLYEALQTGVPNHAENPGHYRLVGDRVGNVPIASIDVTIIPPVAGDPATATIQLNFSEPLEDDRFTLIILDSLQDPAGNGFDGESNAALPLGNPTFPSGDGIAGGAFSARFTVDSRAEIGVHGQVGITIDANGNFIQDPTVSGGTDIDLTRDLVFQFGLQHDAVFAGQFTPPGVGSNGYDRLGAYGLENGGFRFLLDFNDNGALDIGEAFSSNVQVNALPLAGDFDNDDDGDEIGLFNGGIWWIDTNGDNILETSFSGNMRGLPFAGDFDGDGLTDLGSFQASTDHFFFDLGHNGLNGHSDAGFTFGFPGVLERPFAGDFNLDGVDDVGLTTPSQTGSDGPLEWYILISQGVPVVGTVNTLHHAFSPTPVGGDFAALFGSGQQVPVVGNFDPPIDLPIIPPEIGGTYSIGGLTATVVQNGGQLTFINEAGGQSSGAFNSETEVVAHQWGGLTAQLINGNIVWANGTVWTLDVPEETTGENTGGGGNGAVSGAYEINGQTVSVVRSGDVVTFVNEHGNASRGQFVTDTQVIATGWGGLLGNIVGGNIEWVNGSTWTDAVAGSYTTNGQLASVERSGNSLIFTNEHGSSAAGQFLSPTEFLVPTWGNLTGNFIDGQIQWANGSSWSTYTGENVSGDFFTGGQRASVSRWGNSLLFTNEHGGTSRGHLLSDNQFIATDWGGLVGTLANGSIQWANGSLWADDISGDYSINGQTAGVSQFGNLLTFTNEHGNVSQGQVLDSTRVVATDWGNLIGHLVDGRIEWNGGSVWAFENGHATADAIDRLFESVNDDWLSQL